MSVVDNAIQQLFKNGCKIKKLWTNASPTSQFAAQKITADMGAFDQVQILLRESTSSTYPYYFIEDFKKNDDGVIVRMLNYDKTGTTVGASYRTVDVGNTGIAFGAGYINQGGVQANNYNLPIIIYGIQILGGVIHKLKNLAASLFTRREVLE